MKSRGNVSLKSQPWQGLCWILKGVSTQIRFARCIFKFWVAINWHLWCPTVKYRREISFSKTCINMKSVTCFQQIGWTHLEYVQPTGAIIGTFISADLYLYITSLQAVLFSTKAIIPPWPRWPAPNSSRLHTYIFHPKSAWLIRNLTTMYIHAWDDLQTEQFLVCIDTWSKIQILMVSKNFFLIYIHDSMQSFKIITFRNTGGTLFKKGLIYQSKNWVLPADTRGQSGAELGIGVSKGSSLETQFWAV